MQQRSSFVLGIVAVITLLTLGVDVVVPLGTPPVPDVTSAGPVVAGGWYCAAVGSGEGDVTRIVTAAPRTELEPPSEVVGAELLGGSRVAVPVVNVFSDQAVTTQLSDGRERVGVEQRWFTHPATVFRVWERRGDGDPDGLVAGPCASRPGTEWYLPGVSTAGGARAAIHVANPFAEAASVAVSFMTPTGEVSPVRLRNQVVPANGVLVLDVGEFMPRESDLGVRVLARSGRVVLEGVQTVDAAIGGVNGTSLVVGVDLPGLTWTVPWSIVGSRPTQAPAPTPPVEVATEQASEGATEAASEEATEVVTDAPTDAATPTDSGAAEAADNPSLPVVNGGPLATTTDNPSTSWVWVSNPSDEPAAVFLTLHGTSGPVIPDLGEELAVEPGSILRIPLDGLLPAGQSAAGVTVTSTNEVPVVVSLGTVVRLAGDDEMQTGYSVQSGLASGDVSWVLSGPASIDGSITLHLTNPGAETALADVVVWDGSVGQRPPALQSITVPAGGLVEVPVDAQLLSGPTFAAFVTVREGQVVVGGRSVRPNAPIDWVVTTGIAASSWRGGDPVPAISQEPGLVERLD